MGFVTETPVLQHAFFARPSQRLHAVCHESTNRHGQTVATASMRQVNGANWTLRRFWPSPTRNGRRVTVLDQGVQDVRFLALSVHGMSDVGWAPRKCLMRGLTR
jgi:hypothetical protein